MYYLKTNFDDDFTDLMMYLKSKYPKKMFNLEGIGDEQTDFSTFSKEFFSTKTTTADVSVDANSNVDGLDVVAYMIELPKPIYKINSYYVLHKKAKQLYGLQKASQLCEDASTGRIYINDFHGIGGGLSYCFNYSTYDIALHGLPMVKKIKSVAPKYLYAFKSQVEQFTVISSNSTLGATGLADLLIVMSLYIDKILRSGHDANFHFPGWYSDSESEKFINGEHVERTTPYNEKVFLHNVWKYAKENLVSLIYTINQPMRGNQSPFTNVSIYGDAFLDQMLSGYILDDHVVSKDTVKKLQRVFLDTMNEELGRTPITFPVTTACFVTDENNDIVSEDTEFLNLVSEQNLKYGFINIYCGKSSTLSSCCFIGNEIIDVNNNGITEITSIQDFIDLHNTENLNEFEKKIDKKYKINSMNFDTLQYEDCYITGVLKKKNSYRKLIKITVNGTVVSVTPDHIFKVKNVETDILEEVNAQQIYTTPDKYLLPIEIDKDYKNIKVDNVEEIEHDGYVYDIELEKNHYFSANKIISHNCRLRSDTESRFFNEEIVYEMELDDGTIRKISSKDTIQVKNLESNSVEEVYIDEIKDKFSIYEII